MWNKMLSSPHWMWHSNCLSPVLSKERSPPSTCRQCFSKCHWRFCWPPLLRGPCWFMVSLLSFTSIHRSFFFSQLDPSVCWCMVDWCFVYLSKNRFSLLNFHWCDEFTGKKYTKFHPLLCHNEHLKTKFVVMHIMMLLSSHWYYYTLICLHIQISVFFLLIFYFLWQCLHINISVAFIGVLFFFYLMPCAFVKIIHLILRHIFTFPLCNIFSFNKIT